MSSPSMRGSFETSPVLEVRDTGVIWSAIIGGAVAATAFTILLAPLGTGLGMLHSSPMEAMNSTDKTFTAMTAIWLILMQWISSGVGGYITGRLRTGWVGAHVHEVFFRDTAHGFLTWGLTTIVGVGLLTAGAAHMAAHHAGMNGRGGSAMGRLSPESYATARLFRTDQAGATVTEQDRMDASMALGHAAEEKNTSDDDRIYLMQLVQSRTGLSPDRAQKRVDDTITQLRETRHTMHKTMAVAGLFVFLSMWIGAFIASAAAALGGRHRDLHYATGRLSED